MTTFKRLISNPEKLSTRITRIKALNGEYTEEKTGNGTVLIYWFPKMVLDLLSPDGISIRPDDYFKDISEAKFYFLKWKRRYDKQGYYSANHGPINLAELMDHCIVREIFL